MTSIITFVIRPFVARAVFPQKRFHPEVTRARIRALQAQLGASHGVDVGDGNSGLGIGSSRFEFLEYHT